MEEEAEKLKQLQTEVDKQMKLNSPSAGGKLIDIIGLPIIIMSSCL